ncbi:ribosomal small subunit pseudouridine synthase A [Ferrimonas sediminum]|uniref:Pseudouridine synthase n=1 Tax=Ferrimonas sediminum TaxID=718193 RepID=A0A1G8JLM5_9GAMM|nr:pseudouridine synthase [Ferrimonas sediminum]SDI31907.1 ribosomal small subunit pseudouridine synthase A [Ferrimonas sediminum]
MRLDKYLCNATELTRSLAKKMLHRGEVTCDGEVVKDSGFKVKPEHTICINGEPTEVRGQRYLMLHKPVDTVCSSVDDGYASVLTLLDLPKREQLKIVGRLDADTTGLLLLTSDGQWSHRITSPNARCGKRYRVILEAAISDEALTQLGDGVLLHGEDSPVRGQVERIDERQIWLTIEEGKYHQVKRMCAAVGNKVVGLHRQQIGALELDAGLAPGQWRPLTEEEIALF